MKGDREMCTAAVAQNGCSEAPEMKCDREMRTATVGQNEAALKYCSEVDIAEWLPPHAADS